MYYRHACPTHRYIFKTNINLNSGLRVRMNHSASCIYQLYISANMTKEKTFLCSHCFIDLSNYLFPKIYFAAIFKEEFI